MRLFANHAHPMPPQLRPHGDVDDLLRLLEDLGVERAVCFAPFALMFREAGLEDDPHQWLADRLAPYPELIGYGCLDPTLPQSLAELDRVVELGFRGVKLHPAIDRFDVTDPRALDFYAAAAARGLVLDFHTGIHGCRIRDLEPLKFDDVACCVPGARLVLEHVGGLAFYEQALAVIANHADEGPSQVYAGVTSVLSEQMPAWHLGPQRVARIAAMCGIGRLIWGLDFPYHQPQVYRRDLELLRSLDLGPGGLEALLGGNLARLLGLPPP